MPEYIDVPIESDPDLLAQASFEFLEERIPEWEPSEGQLDVWLIEAVAQLVADAADIASDVPLSIFRYFGATIMNLPPQDAVAASVTSTWTMRDNAGYTIPEGTNVGLRDDAGDLIPFQVVEDVIVPTGSTVTNAGAVVLLQLLDEDSGEGGVSGNGLAGPAELIDSLEFVIGIVIVGTSSGGADAEDDIVYTDRLAEEMQLSAPRPIVAHDFAVLAKRHPSVARATAIDGYNLDTATAGQEKCVTVITVDEAGNANTTTVKNEVDATLETQREVNFLVFVGDPTYSNIDVTSTVRALPGVEWDLADIDLRCEAAISDYLDSVNWGLSASSGADEWVNETTIRGFELATVLNNVDGVNYVETLTFAIAGNALGTVNVVLPGIAPMPRPGTIIITVNAA